MLIPAMKKQGYEAEYAVAVTAGASMLSPIIPPSIAMILYSFYTEVPVGKLFISGILPGVVIGVLMMVVNSIYYRVRKYNIPVVRFSFRNLGKQFIRSIWALITPLIILCGIVFGFVTPTESGVLAILYGLFYGFFISRELKIGAIPRILMNSAVTTAVVLVTIAAAGVLGNVLVRLHFQTEVVNFAINVIQNRYLATLFIMLVMLVLGCFLDPTVLIAMFAVSILSVGNALGFDPIQYGLIMIIIMQVGAITPPVGTFLFISCGVGEIPLERSVKPLMPFILVIMIVIIAMLFIPGIATWVPSLLGR
jgi:tripartite ATP-independent transporter DctM subunit